MLNKQSYGQPFFVTTSGTATAIATQSGTANSIFYVTDISISSSGTSGTWVLLAGATVESGTVTLWQGAGAVNTHISQPLPGNPGGSILLTANGTTTTYANMTGFFL